MFKHQFLVAAILALIVFTPQGSHAQTLDMAAAVTRMNSIIAEMEKLRAEFATLASSVGKPATPAPVVLGAQSKSVFTLSLEQGETNSDIGRIQKLLATDPEIYPYGVVSGFFGPKTEEGIKNFQTRFGLDPIGIVGPSTKALLELFINAYPDGKYPADVLKKKPQVQGATTSNPPAAPTVPSTGTNPAERINVVFDSPESLITIIYTNGNRKGFVADTTDKDEIVTFIASRTVLTEAMVRAVIKYGANSDEDDEDEDEDGDSESEAEDALDEAEDALDDAADEIAEADEDGDDVKWAEDTLEDAEDAFDDAEEAYDDEDYRDAIKFANKARKLAKDAEDRIDEEEDEDSNGDKGDSDDIESIYVEVGDGESEVVVEYGDGEEYDFTVEEDKEDDIIAEIADELNIDEDEVEDLVEFDYGDIDSIEVRISDDGSLARVFYEGGSERRLRFTETDEDDIINELADELNEDEDDIEDWVDFM